MMNSALIWLDCAHSAAWNMAADELLLEEAFSVNRAILRYYTWSEPSVSYGYSQKKEVLPCRDLPSVRRPTGGGIVFHGEDITYTLAVPHDSPLCRLNRVESYRAIHDCVARALDDVSGHTFLAPEQPKHDRATLQCFRSPSMYDVLASDGAKLAGAAQRRTRQGILHQGSIQKIPWPLRESVRKNLTRVLSIAFSFSFGEYCPGEDFLNRVQVLATEKYMEKEP